MTKILHPALAATILLMLNCAQAADTAPLADSFSFFGRWDLRAPDRAITVNTGSYIYVHFETTVDNAALQARFDITANGAERPTIAWRIDQGNWHEDEIWPIVQFDEKIKAGPHTACLMVRGLDEHHSRWRQPLISSITFLGFDITGGKFLPPLDEWVHPKLKIEFLGDSITEGVLVGTPFNTRGSWPWQTDALRSWAWLTGTNLGAAFRQVGFGATGIDHGGSGGAAASIDAFNFFYDGCPRDDWQPDLVVINQGTNNGGSPSDYFATLYGKYLTLIRQAYPHAKIAAVRPFGGYQEAAIKKAVETAQTAGDKNIYYIDTTGWYSGGLHPGWQNSAGLADKMTNALKTQVLGWGPTPPAPTPSLNVPKP